MIRIALAQMNAVVGGLAQNVETLHRLRTQAGAVGASLVVAPELALTGYPPEDLLLKEGFCESARMALDDLARPQNLPAMLVGTIVAEGEGVVLAPSLDGRDVTRLINQGHVTLPHIANALATVSSQGVGPISTKRLLPNYDVFDEQRYFHPGLGEGSIINVEGVAVGLLICEDVWTAQGPAADLAAQGATLLVVANASPFARGRRDDREAMLRERARETGCPIAYVNLVGGQDELVFDGQSVVVDAQGRVLARAAAFSEELLVVEVEARHSSVGAVVATAYARDERAALSPHVNHVCEPASDVAEVYDALVMGTRDYLPSPWTRSALGR